MNIKQAKEQIKNAMTAYFTKDELGNYAIPIERQRPVFLIGPPGIGKTAIMAGAGRSTFELFHDAPYPPKRAGSAVHIP